MQSNRESHFEPTSNTSGTVINVTQTNIVNYHYNHFSSDNLAVERAIAFLQQLGFNPSEVAFITTYSTHVISAIQEGYRHGLTDIEMNYIFTTNPPQTPDVNKDVKLTRLVTALESLNQYPNINHFMFEHTKSWGIHFNKLYLQEGFTQEFIDFLIKDEIFIDKIGVLAKTVVIFKHLQISPQAYMEQFPNFIRLQKNRALVHQKMVQDMTAGNPQQSSAECLSNHHSSAVNHNKPITNYPTFFMRSNDSLNSLNNSQSTNQKTLERVVNNL